MLQIIKQQEKASRHGYSSEQVESGVTGLSNIGNTCFMNSAIQCVSNTQPLTQYFRRDLHLYELNRCVCCRPSAACRLLPTVCWWPSAGGRLLPAVCWWPSAGGHLLVAVCCRPTRHCATNLWLIWFVCRDNPLGMKGRLAQVYGNLIQELWNGTKKCIPPVNLRFTLAKYAPQFSGFQQHDAQELLAFLLDGLHEDLNRYTNRSIYPTRPFIQPDASIYPTCPSIRPVRLSYLSVYPTRPSIRPVRLSDPSVYPIRLSIWPVCLSNPFVHWTLEADQIVIQLCRIKVRSHLLLHLLWVAFWYLLSMDTMCHSYL